ncbi:MAG: hypothetical protein QOJ64_3192 [Acidobacteriota bacterium]|nr:hypothetical protein [Acidobacteriota bacterium]
MFPRSLARWFFELELRGLVLPRESLFMSAFAAGRSHRLTSGGKAAATHHFLRVSTYALKVVR